MTVAEALKVSRAVTVTAARALTMAEALTVSRAVTVTAAGALTMAEALTVGKAVTVTSLVGLEQCIPGNSRVLSLSEPQSALHFKGTGTVFVLCSSLCFRSLRSVQFGMNPLLHRGVLLLH